MRESLKDRMKRREMETALTVRDKETILHARKTDAAFQQLIDADKALEELETLTLDNLAEENAKLAADRREIEAEAIRNQTIWIDQKFSANTFTH